MEPETIFVVVGIGVGIGVGYMLVSLLYFVWSDYRHRERMRRIDEKYRELKRRRK